MLLPLDGGRSPQLLLGTFNRGLFRYDGKTFTPFATDADAYLRERTLYKGHRAPGRDLRLLDDQRRPRRHEPRRGTHCTTSTRPRACRTTTRLPCTPITPGWCGSHPKGRCARSKPPRRCRGSTSTSGCRAASSDVVRHKGVLYAATSVGVFYLDTASSTFKQITGFREGNSQATGLASNGDVLMVGYGSGLHQVDGAVAHVVKPNIGASFSSGAIRFSAA